MQWRKKWRHFQKNCIFKTWQSENDGTRIHRHRYHISWEYTVVWNISYVSVLLHNLRSTLRDVCLMTVPVRYTLHARTCSSSTYSYVALISLHISQKRHCTYEYDTINGIANAATFFICQHGISLVFFIMCMIVKAHCHSYNYSMQLLFALSAVQNPKSTRRSASA